MIFDTPARESRPVEFRALPGALMHGLAAQIQWGWAFIQPRQEPYLWAAVKCVGRCVLRCSVYD
jgi:hypothetical protein